MGESRLREVVAHGGSTVLLSLLSLLLFICSIAQDFPVYK